MIKIIDEYIKSLEQQKINNDQKHSELTNLKINVISLKIERFLFH